MIKPGDIVVSKNTGAIVRVHTVDSIDLFSGTKLGDDKTKKYLYRNNAPKGEFHMNYSVISFVPYLNKSLVKLKII